MRKFVTPDNLEELEGIRFIAVIDINLAVLVIKPGKIVITGNKSLCFSK